MAKPAPHGALRKVTLNLYAEDVELAKDLFPRGSVGGWSLMVREIIHAYMESRRKVLNRNLNLGETKPNDGISDPTSGDSPSNTRGT